MRRAVLVSQHGKGTDWVSPVSQLSVTCIPCEPSSSSLGIRHPGSSPRSGRCRKVSGQGHPHDSSRLQAWVCAVGEVLGGAGTAVLQPKG